MIKHVCKNKLLTAFLTFSLLATSCGGALALPAAAAAPETAAGESTVKDAGANTGILAAIAAVGLIAALSSGGSSGDKAAANKGTGSGQGSSSGTGSSSGSGSSQGSGSGQTGTAGTGSEAQQALTLLNNDRAANGQPALRANAQLSQLAQNYAQDMINRGFFAHNNPEGQSPFDRMKQAGISYKYAGENLAANANVASAEVALMNSSGHRANILSPNYTDVGIGVAHTASGGVYVVQEFIGK